MVNISTEFDISASILISAFLRGTPITGYCFLAASSHDQATERTFHDYGDGLHSVISRLRLIRNPDANSTSTIKLHNVLTRREDGSILVQALVQAFRRLPNLTSAQNLVITIDSNNLETEVFSSNPPSHKAAAY
ncbi:uncharacterized protein BP5553_00718 [Venustampulla echinocandica]|uniref:Uncharacterized protein n=1 Tax=Venustampulla echinocandica TaxID=2656787 RepID=A0A370TYY2_9HELO|nr:uncharacterized protein BP5553_00718 [Venustampulla echinocandica]RDL40739.1 hypothetical protein BP5553_00718 [Venustampulla echinocandica]